MNKSKEPPNAELRQLDASYVARVFREFEIAESFVKEVEDFCDEVAIPSINELRYVAFHILRALCDKGANGDEELRKSLGHCQRAIYDAGAAGIISAIEHIEIFESEYRQIAISDVVENWSSKRAEVGGIRDSEPLKRMSSEDRDGDFEYVKDAFIRLREIYRELEAARDDLNKKIAEARKDSRRFIISIVVTIALAVLGIAVTVALAG